LIGGEIVELWEGESAAVDRGWRSCSWTKLSMSLKSLERDLHVERYLADLLGFPGLCISVDGKRPDLFC
jgi:hypothetical protein